MKKQIFILFSIFFSYIAVAQTEVYITPLPFFSGIQASASIYGFKRTETSTIENARINTLIFNTNIIKNNKYKYSFSLGVTNLGALNFRINRKYLLSTTPDEELFFSKKNRRLKAKTPQIEFSISRLFQLPKNYYFGLGFNAIGLYITKYPPIMYMVEHDVHDIVYGYGNNILDKKIGSLEQIAFTRRNHFNYGLGPSILFGYQVQRIRIEAYANLIFKSPEFYDVEHTIFPTNEEKIRSFTAKYAQFPMPIYQLGITFSYKIIEL